MKPIQKQVQHLTLWSLPPATNSTLQDRVVLILGNAYGIMPYQLPLAEALAARGLEPWWFAFSGQEGADGVYSGLAGLHDISVAIKHLSVLKRGQRLWMIGHCAGGLMSLEFLRRNPDAPVEKLIIYGLLFNPARRRELALPRFKKYGVKLGLTDIEWNYNPLPALSEIRIPILFCHPKDKINLSRTTEEEMAAVMKTAARAEIAWFQKGYDVDLEPIEDFVRCYCSWLTSLSVQIEKRQEVKI